MDSTTSEYFLSSRWPSRKDRPLSSYNEKDRNAPEMVGVYAHLTMRDVEEKDLVLHGMKPKEEILRPISQVVKCVCGQENAPIAVYCVGCGTLLASEQMADLTKALSNPKFVQSPINSETFKEALRKALGE